MYDLVLYADGEAVALAGGAVVRPCPGETGLPYFVGHDADGEAVRVVLRPPVEADTDGVVLDRVDGARHGWAAV